MRILFVNHTSAASGADFPLLGSSAAFAASITWP